MKFTPEHTAHALRLLEAGFFGTLAEEFLIRVGTARASYFHLNDELKKFAELCRTFPQNLCQLKIDWQKTKENIVQEMLKTSLLISDNDTHSFPVSGNPFPTIHKNQNKN